MAMMIGTAALILVLSVFNGFEGLVKSLYSSFYPDIKITPVSGKQLTLTSAQIEQLRGIKGINYLSFFVEEKALLKNGEAQSIINLKGVDKNYTKVNSMEQHIVKGDLIRAMKSRHCWCWEQELKML